MSGISGACETRLTLRRGELRFVGSGLTEEPDDHHRDIILVVRGKHGLQDPVA
jgi:hypothetical protein